jgi:hypothetical protein
MAIAKPECAQQTDVTALPSRAAVHYRQHSVPQDSLELCGNDEPEPLILREYDASFARLFVYNLLWVTLLAACIALWLVLS